MTTLAVLATGPSMSQAVADEVRDAGCRAVAVSDAYRLAPWADALVSHDAGWWNVHQDALQFQGRKFCSVPRRGTETLPVSPEFGHGCNSGLQGMRVARDLYGATRILLLGFDMHGTHFFGKHQEPLRNTSATRRREMLAQFGQWRGGCEVVNCTPGSALKQFRMSTIEEELA